MVEKDFYKESYEKFGLIADPRTEDWLLVKDWWPTYAISVGYLLTVKYLSKWMKTRPEYNLTPLMIIYNVLMVVLSGYMFIWFLFYGLNTGMTPLCWPVSSERNYYTNGLAHVFWWFYFSKILEYLDTIFFILRKKFGLVTLLHVYHHTVMPITTWLSVRFVPGGYLCFSFMLNAFVHVFMYTYYALAAAGPRFRKYLFWKQYMTLLQIVQFIIVIFHSTYSLVAKCSYPKVIPFLTLSNGVIFLVLFMQYYMQSYKSQRPNSKIE